MDLLSRKLLIWQIFQRLDHRVFQVCKDLKKKRQKVILISRNPNIRLKGNQLGIDTELFKDEIFPKPCDQYKGIVEVFMPGSSLEKMFTDERGVPVEEVYQYENFDWIENEFVEIVSDTSKAIGRYTNGRIVRLKYDKSIREDIRLSMWSRLYSGNPCLCHLI